VASCEVGSRTLANARNAARSLAGGDKPSVKDRAAAEPRRDGQETGRKRSIMMLLSVEMEGFGKIGTVSNVTVNKPFPDPFPDFVCIPPDGEDVARINRGSNMHGTLIDSFYLGANNFPDDATYFVLWIGLDGSQFDDHQSRLLPAAYAEMEYFYDEDYGHQKRLAAAALLYVWVKSNSSGEGIWDYNSDDEFTSGYLISDKQLELIQKDALARNPFKFIDPIE
jgi:hypothetical protein